MNSTRLAPPRVPTDRIVLQPPPELDTNEGGSGVLSSLLPLLGSVGSIVMVTISNSGPTGFLTGGMFLLSSLGFVAVNGWRQRAQRQSATLGARREYLAYLAELRQSVRAAAKQQRRAGNWTHPAPQTIPFLAEERTRVFERSPLDADFLLVRVGVSDQPLCTPLEAPELPPLAQLDPVAASAAHRFMLAHEVQPRLPFAVRIDDAARVELTGEVDEVRALARSIIVSAAALHSPEVLQIAVVAEPGSLAHWDWAKWLPHAQSRYAEDGIGPARMIAGSIDEVVGMLPPKLRERPVLGSDGASAARLPHVLIVTDGVRLPQADPLFDDRGLAGVTVLDLPVSWGELESHTVLRAAFDAGSEGRSAQLLSTYSSPRPFTPDAIGIVEAEAIARRLAPLHTTTTAIVEGSAPTLVGQAELVELLGLPDVRDLDFATTWRYRPQRERLRVPIGQTATGAPLVLDLKEAGQQGMGPHGILIGATGSGKSEVLRTLVLSLALTHSPEQLNFVLVDFKGGATFAGITDMPHVSAVITNLGEELSLVDRMQDALIGEMTRRQELLRAAGNFSSVSDYEKARLGGRDDLAPLPSLLIVADEFSELLTAKPEFIETFVAIGRLGRSLQIHLLLASQRLEEGKLRGLDTYLSYRIGLRTFSPAESRAVLGVPDAYHLPSEPGVGYLKFDTESMTQFKAAYVSAPPPRRALTAAGAAAQSAPATVELFTSARVAPRRIEVAAAPAQQAVEHERPEERSVLDLAVARMQGLGASAHQVWLPPLEVPATLDQLFGDLQIHPELGLVSPAWRAAGPLTVPLGIVDVPLEQRREALVLSLTGAAGHLAIVGGPRSGKSTLARTLVAALALTQTPLEVQAYVLDFGGGTFTGLAGLPHVAGLATRSEPDVVRRMVAEVTSILDAREAYFRANGIDGIETYRQRRAAGLVDDGYGDLFLIVDGWATLREEHEALEAKVQSIAARGLAFGVHIVLTAARWMEIRPAVRDLVGSRLELKLGDSSDSEVDRKKQAGVPTQPGRGLSPSGLHVLSALPRVDGSGDASTLAAGVEHLVAVARDSWHGPAAPKLRLLPERIALTELRPDGAPEPSEFILGIDEASLSPVRFDPVAEPLLYLYGDADSGKSSMLRLVAHEIMRRYSPKQAKIFTVDYRRALLGEIPADYLGAALTQHEEVEGGIGQLVELFKSRLPPRDVTPEQLRTRSWWTGAEGFILIDDYDLVSTSMGNPVQALASLLPQAADVGLHLVLTRRSGGASRAAYDPIIQRMTDLGATGILLSGNPEEGALIGRAKPVRSLPGRAQIISRDRGLIPAQLAWVPPRHQR